MTFADAAYDEAIDDAWPCGYCREPRHACGCEAAASCRECGEFWEHCACARTLDPEQEAQRC